MILKVSSGYTNIFGLNFLLSIKQAHLQSSTNFNPESGPCSTDTATGYYSLTERVPVIQGGCTAYPVVVQEHPGQQEENSTSELHEVSH